MSLLTLAEDQLALNAQRMEAAEKRLQMQDQAFDRYLKRMAEKHNKLHQQYEANLQQQSARFAQLLDRKIWVVAVAAPVLCGALIVWAYGMYLQSSRDELKSAEKALEALKDYNAQFSYCDRGKKSYPCIRVRTDWQGYGADRNYLIIDPK
ncbi:MAG: hypothetical protein ACPG51_20335 [Thiolinea sp.]